MSIAVEQLSQGALMENCDKRFDAEGFYAAIAATVVARKVTWKQVGRETGISTTTLTRMALRGDGPMRRVSRPCPLGPALTRPTLCDAIYQGIGRNR